MPEVTLYDNLDQPVTDEGSVLSNGGSASFSFMTGSASGTLSDVKLILVDSTPNDGGSVVVRLFTSGIINSSQEQEPATKVADLGIISDSSLSLSTKVTDVPITTTINLAPKTSYFIEVTGFAGSSAALAREADDKGTGVAGNHNVYMRGDGVTSFNDGSAYIGQVTENVTCFTSGTLIRTVRGDFPVEDLRVGDFAVTASGVMRPIAWIGHRAVDGGAQPLPHDRQPIRVRAGAFGLDLPIRDLYLSPGHPVLVAADADGEEGCLVPIMCLINGTTIERVPVSQVTYWHIELDQHDILLAEGLPAESYLDWGDRPFFTESADHALANPDFVVPGLAGRCRPVVLDGPIVEAERCRLDAVLASRLSSAAAWPNVENELLMPF